MTIKTVVIPANLGSTLLRDEANKKYEVNIDTTTLVKDANGVIKLNLDPATATDLAQFVTDHAVQTVEFTTTTDVDGNVFLNVLADGAVIGSINMTDMIPTVVVSTTSFSGEKIIFKDSEDTVVGELDLSTFLTEADVVAGDGITVGPAGTAATLTFPTGIAPGDTLTNSELGTVYSYAEYVDFAGYKLYRVNMSNGDVENMYITTTSNWSNRASITTWDNIAVGGALAGSELAGWGGKLVPGTAQPGVIKISVNLAPAQDGVANAATIVNGQLYVASPTSLATVELQDAFGESIGFIFPPAPVQ